MTGVAVLAGGNQRLGRAVVERLRRDGLMLATIGEEPVGADLMIEAHRLSDRQRMKEAARRVEQELGQASILITAPRRVQEVTEMPFGTMSGDGWQQLLDAYLGAATAACAAFVPSMVAAGRGCVITLSSSVALVGARGNAYLAAASGTVVGFSKSFALEVARHGVRVNCIAAGPGNAVTAEEIAETVAFLARDADFYVGQVLAPGAAV